MSATDIPMQMCKEMEPKSMSRPKQWSESVSNMTGFPPPFFIYYSNNPHIMQYNG